MPSKIFCNCWQKITLFSSESAHLIPDTSIRYQVWRLIFVSISKTGLVTDAVANFSLAIAITLMKQLMRLNCLTQVTSLNREWIEEAAEIILVVILLWSIPVPVHYGLELLQLGCQKFSRILSNQSVLTKVGFSQCLVSLNKSKIYCCRAAIVASGHLCKPKVKAAQMKANTWIAKSILSWTATRLDQDAGRFEVARLGI